METNQTIYSSYNLTASELAVQQQEIQAFQNELENSRKGICGGLFGIRGDEEQPALVNSSTELPTIELLNRNKGSLIAGFVNSNNNKPTKPCQIVSGWSCRKMGRFPHPTHCQKYVQCHFCGDNTVYECPYEQAFDGWQCSSDWSSCGHIEGCQHDRQLIPDPWNHSNYFICIRKKGFFHKFLVFRRFCLDGFEFDAAKLQCTKTVIVVVKPCEKPCKHCEKPCKPTKPPCHNGCNNYGK